MYFRLLYLNAFQNKTCVNRNVDIFNPVKKTLYAVKRPKYIV